MSGLLTRVYKDLYTVRDLANYAQLYGDPNEIFLYQVFAENTDVDAGVAEDVWSVGGIRAKPGAAEYFNVKSTSALDALGSTGTTLLYVEGLDSNYDRANEYIAMNGTTNVSTVRAYRHINRALSGVVGTGGGNAGTITLTGVTSTNVMVGIPIGYNISQLSHFMVPAGFTGYILDETTGIYNGETSGDRQGVINTWIQIPDFASFRTAIRGALSATTVHEYPAGLVVREKSLIWHSCLAASNNSDVSTQMNILMIKSEFVRTP